MPAVPTPGSPQSGSSPAAQPRTVVSVWFMVLSFLFAMLVALTALHEARQRRADTALVFPPGAITPTVGRRSGGGYTTRQTPGHERLLTLRPAALDARAMDWPAAVASESH